MLKYPITRPLKSEVHRNETPFTVPTCPFTLARSSSLKSKLTQVESAMLRKLPTMVPSIKITMKIQSETERIETAATSGRVKKSVVAMMNAVNERRLEPSMTCFFLLWSTMAPKKRAVMALLIAKMPAMREVARMDLVSVKIQNVKQNQAKELVRVVTNVLMRRERKMVVLGGVVIGISARVVG